MHEYGRVRDYMKDRNGVVNRTIFIVLLVILVIVLRLYSYQNSVQNQAGNLREEISVEVPTISVVPKIALTQVSIDEQTIKPEVATKFAVNANSEKQVVTAYDMVFKIEKIGTGSGTISLVSAKSENPSFDIFPTLKNNLLILTGAKKINATTQSVFDNEKIADFTVVAKGNSHFKLSLVEKDEKTKARSRLMNDQAEEITTDLAGFKVLLEPK